MKLQVNFLKWKYVYRGKLLCTLNNLLCFMYFRRTTQSLSQAQMVGPWETELTLYLLVLALEACAFTPAPFSLLVNVFIYFFVHWPQWFILATV